MHLLYSRLKTSVHAKETSIEATRIWRLERVSLVQTKKTRAVLFSHCLPGGKIPRKTASQPSTYLKRATGIQSVPSRVIQTFTLSRGLFDLIPYTHHTNYLEYALSLLAPFQIWIETTNHSSRSVADSFRFSDDQIRSDLFISGGLCWYETRSPRRFTIGSGFRNANEAYPLGVCFESVSQPKTSLQVYISGIISILIGDPVMELIGLYILWLGSQIRKNEMTRPSLLARGNELWPCKGHDRGMRIYTHA